ncbi:MAG TPA: ABC transporter ATP-binding protein [Cyclobacteriaceae bacterium]|nr:ABC transporter ATP-binding protein [Cyclobacteriaceae bacterium]
MKDSQPILEALHISRSFSDPVPNQVLTDVTFSVDAGEFVSVIGKSGCGKSTLLYILSTMDTDYEGEVRIDQESMVDKSAKELARIRNSKIGFVFQFHYLLNEFNVLKNVMLPGLKLNRFSEEEVESRAYDRLKMLGMEKMALKGAHQLSGGEKQRVAIARALINDPLIIMGDEPTGNLDKKNSDLVFDIFATLTTQFKQTLLIVTHDLTFSSRTHRVIEMEDGQIIKQYLN